MEILEELIGEVHEIVPTLPFDEILRRCREAIGMFAYAAAEILDISAYRLKILESGSFRTMPSKKELRILSKLYGIPEEVLKYKAQEHVDGLKFKRVKKKYRTVHVMCDHDRGVL